MASQRYIKYFQHPKIWSNHRYRWASHYPIKKTLLHLLSPYKKLTLKDSFEAANHVQNIPPSLFVNGYGHI